MLVRQSSQLLPVSVVPGTIVAPVEAVSLYGELAPQTVAVAVGVLGGDSGSVL